MSLMFCRNLEWLEISTQTLICFFRFYFILLTQVLSLIYSVQLIISYQKPQSNDTFYDINFMKMNVMICYPLLKMNLLIPEFFNYRIIDNGLLKAFLDRFYIDSFFIINIQEQSHWIVLIFLLTHIIANIFDE